jgi:Zn-dependent protease with chaperone function
MVGARLVDPSTRDLLERRLVNVVEEMAIAAGIAVPRVYVMDNETAINAFAAGHSVNDAIVAVTRGTLTRLTRDELQGVIGHEFSHILNGDMRLNLRLIGVLFGLMMIALFGRFLMEMSRGSRNSRGVGALIVAGLVLWIVGYIGVFFGRLIKAGVSRQREFLADASSVQFTRNPDGIGGALRKIGGLTQETGLGTQIDHSHAETLSHLFLGAARRNFASGLMATHPPLAERIKRIYGRALAFVPAPEQPLQMAMGSATAAERAAGADLPPLPFTGSASPVAGLMTAASGDESVSNAIGLLTPQAHEFGRRIAAPAPSSSLIETTLVDTTAVQLLVLGMLIEKDQATSGQQRQLVTEAFGASAAQQVDALHEAVARLPPGRRLSLLDRAMPTLRKLPIASGDRLLMLCHALISADGRVTLPEFLLFTVLRHRIGRAAQRAVPLKFRAVSECAGEAALVMSLVAAVRLPERAEHAFNAGVLLLPGTELSRTGADAIELSRVAAALDRLNQLAPLAKPKLIKACTAIAFVDGSTNWKAASCLRTICAALDAPLPPQVDGAPDADDASAPQPAAPMQGKLL